MGAEYGPGVMYCAECGRPTPADQLARFGDTMICPDCKNPYAQKLREGVTPAALQPQAQYGGFWVRFVAVVIDGIILGVVQSIVQFAFLGRYLGGSIINPGMRPEEAIGAAFGMFGLVFVFSMALGCAYETFFIAQYGATPGKMALGLKVVRPNLAPVGAGRAAGRYFGKQLSAMILGIGYIIAAFDGEKRALHDMICDTRVIGQPR
jgi:uncharacterized RDD family membrane protein YckC